MNKKYLAAVIAVSLVLGACDDAITDDGTTEEFARFIEAVEFNDEFMEAIAYFAYEASSDLAAERESYSSFEGSKWSRGIMPLDSLELLEEERGLSIDVARGSKMDWDALRQKIQKQGMRNSNVLAIAPTATISIP